ncbi:hypothetical protein HanIR_Chr13g0634981 [Helianthus annuus]|nr:hypothetical protein HanIR_Chr13g0634981 [Helianthus annuus]
MEKPRAVTSWNSHYQRSEIARPWCGLLAQTSLVSTPVADPGIFSYGFTFFVVKLSQPYHRIFGSVRLGRVNFILLQALISDSQSDITSSQLTISKWPTHFRFQIVN